VKSVSNWLETQPGIPTAAEREQEGLASAAPTAIFANFWDEQDAAKRH
jgi:hypothetical protein